jgi:hypothetical protein
VWLGVSTLYYLYTKALTELAICFSSVSFASSRVTCLLSIHPANTNLAHVTKQLHSGSLGHTDYLVHLAGVGIKSLHLSVNRFLPNNGLQTGFVDESVVLQHMLQDLAGLSRTADPNTRTHIASSDIISSVQELHSKNENKKESVQEHK